ncbi:PilZ domain-containing protein [Alteromonadaceae bacterium Bs31]|nr:PilZ domain-containing protein [Alteromonadaceae bacterium Bs31]
MTAKLNEKLLHDGMPVLNGLLNSWLGWYGYWSRWLFDYEDTLMRQFIRHPSGIPISYCLGRARTKLSAVQRDFFASDRLRDVSRGGLCFNADCPVRKGTPIHIEISIHSPPYAAEGTVAWCRPEGDHFAVGVRFDEPSTRYSIRMVEQVCHIEHYRASILESEGRELSSEQAANEWVEKYAAEFPA